MSEIITSVKGTNGNINLFNDYLIISRKGLGALISQGKQDDRKIYLKDINKVNYQKPTIFKNGYIQILFDEQNIKDLTSKESLSDPNTILIKAFKKQNVIDSENFYTKINKRLKSDDIINSSSNKTSEKYSVDKIMNVIIDRNNNEISRKKNIFSSELETYSLDDIDSYEINQKNNSKTKHHRVTRALVGDMLLGGAGAVIGAFTGGKKNEYIDYLSVNINFKNNRVWEIKFITTKTKTDSFICKESLSKLKKLCTILDQVLKDNNSDVDN